MRDIYYETKTFLVQYGERVDRVWPILFAVLGKHLIAISIDSVFQSTLLDYVPKMSRDFPKCPVLLVHSFSNSGCVEARASELKV